MNLARFSEIISSIFLFWWLVILTTIALFRTGPTLVSIKILLPVFLIIDGINPLFFYLLRKNGRITDRHMMKREERPLFFALVSILALFSVFLSYFTANFEFFVLNLTLFVLALSMFILTLLFKISGHVLLNMSVIFLLNYLLDWKLLGLFVVVPIVAFARLYLKRHTLFQVLAGAAVGLVEPYLILKLFKLL